MREPTPIHDSRESGPFETGPAAEAATEVGADDDLRGSDWLETLLLVIVVVGTTALIAALV